MAIASLYEATADESQALAKASGDGVASGRQLPPKGRQRTAIVVGLEIWEILREWDTNTAFVPYPPCGAGSLCEPTFHRW